MKKILLLNVLSFFLYYSCKAQGPEEHCFLARFTPKVYYVSNNQFKIPAGYELQIHGIFNDIYSSAGYEKFLSDYWTFLISSKEGTIGIRTPFVPYDSTRKTILRITDTTKTFCRIVPYDSIMTRIPENVLYNGEYKIYSFLRRKRKRENMIITNDSLTIYLINIRPKHLDAVQKKVTTPIDMN